MISNEKIEKLADFWKEGTAMKVMEECGELIQALAKYETFMVCSHPDMTADEINDKCEKFRDKLLNEIADVYISLEILKSREVIDENELNLLIEKKLNN